MPLPWLVAAALAVEVLPPSAPVGTSVYDVVPTADGWLAWGPGAVARLAPDGSWAAVPPACPGGSGNRPTSGGIVWRCDDGAWSANGVVITPKSDRGGFTDGWITADGRAVLFEHERGSHAVHDLPSGTRRLGLGDAGVESPPWLAGVSVRAVGARWVLELLHQGGLAVVDLTSGQRRQVPATHERTDPIAAAFSPDDRRAVIAFYVSDVRDGYVYDGSYELLLIDPAAAAIVTRRTVDRIVDVGFSDGKVAVVEGTDLVLRDPDSLAEVGRVALRAELDEVAPGPAGLALVGTFGAFMAHVGTGAPMWKPGRTSLVPLRGTAHGVFAMAAGLTFRVDGTPAWLPEGTAAGQVRLDATGAHWPDGRTMAPAALPAGTLVDASATMAVFDVRKADARDPVFELVAADGTRSRSRCDHFVRLGESLQLCWTFDEAYLARADGEVVEYGLVPENGATLLDARFTPRGSPVLAWMRPDGSGVAALVDGRDAPVGRPSPAREGGALSQDGVRAAFLDYTDEDDARLVVTVVNVATGAVALQTKVRVPYAKVSAAFDASGRSLYVGFAHGALHRFDLSPPPAVPAPGPKLAEWR